MKIYLVILHPPELHPLGINLTKDMKDLYAENYKTLIRSSHCGPVEMNLTSIREDAAPIPGLAQ